MTFRSFPDRLRRVAVALLRGAVLASLSVGLGTIAPTSASGQSEGVLPRTTRLPASTRAMALGDAYAMDSGHADAIFYHPALLTGAGGFGLELQRWGSAASAAAASGAVQWLGGGVGIGLRSLQYGAAGSGTAAAPRGQDAMFDFGTTPVSELVGTIAYARETWFDIDLGVAVDLVDERVGTQRHGVTLFDVSLAREVGPARSRFSTPATDLRDSSWAPPATARSCGSSTSVTPPRWGSTMTRSPTVAAWRSVTGRSPDGPS
jgi:hypothetical protein